MRDPKHRIQEVDPLTNAWQSAWTPPDRRPIYEWASENVDLPNCYSVTGRFDAEKVPFIKEPMDALLDPTVREVCCMSSVQSLKTLMGELWLLHTIAENPGPTQWLQQTDDDAKEHARTRFNVLLEGCPRLARYFTRNRHDKHIAALYLSHMSLIMEGGSNIRNLQRKSIRNQMRSEVWQWPPGHLQEADARMTQFWFNSKAYTESQPGLEHDDLHERFLAGDQNHWHVACVSCGTYQPLRWTVNRPDGTLAGMRWEDSEQTRLPDGEWNLTALEPTVRYECVKCGFGMKDEPRTRRLLNATGKFLPSAPTAPKRIRSFSWNQLTVEGLSWFNQVVRFLRAKSAYKRGVLEPLQEFFNKCLAEPWSESVVMSTDAPVTVAYEVTSAWEDEHARFLTVDVQADGIFWAVVRAWSKTGESRRLWFGKLFSYADIRGKQTEFQVTANHVLIDSGYEAREVYSKCCEFGWIALKGDPTVSFRHHVRVKGQAVLVSRSYAPLTRGDPERGTAREGSRFAKLIRWSNPTIKDRLKRLRDGKGSKWYVPAAAGDQEANETEYNRQMAAEYKKQKVDKTTGRRSWQWVCPSGNNHAFDCEAMQVLAATLQGLLPDISSESD
jgi:hypothetical protein